MPNQPFYIDEENGRKELGAVPTLPTLRSNRLNLGAVDAPAFSPPPLRPVCPWNCPPYTRCFISFSLLPSDA